MADSPLDGRGPHPKNPGDRKYHNGDEITLEANAALSAGQWATLDGDGTISDPASAADGQVVVKHDAESGEKVAVHTGGVVLALNVGAGTQVDSVDGNPLVHF
jgi:hypothetical protein